MEGPSLFLAAEQLKPFKKQSVKKVSGNSKIGIERLKKQNIKDIFSWGKHLVFQFESFALRVHFMLFGSFAAVAKNKSVTGDYKKKNREPRLKLEFSNGQIEMYSCSLKYLEEKLAKAAYDFSIDLMSREWNEKQALKKLKKQSDEQIADVLLDQTIFAGVGNIIKNEILFLARVHPEKKVKDISLPKLKKLVQLSRTFSFSILRMAQRIYVKEESENL